MRSAHSESVKARRLAATIRPMRDKRRAKWFGAPRDPPGKHRVPRRRASGGSDLRHCGACRSIGLFGKLVCRASGSSALISTSATPPRKCEQLQRLEARVEHVPVKAEAGEWMLEQRDDGDRIAGAERRLEKQLQQRALRRGGKRRAGQIVGQNAEAGKLRHHPPGEIAVRRDQRRLALAVPSGLFQRQPQRDGDRGCLLRSLAASIRGDIGEGSTQCSLPRRSFFHAPQPLVAFCRVQGPATEFLRAPSRSRLGASCNASTSLRVSFSRLSSSDEAILRMAPACRDRLLAGAGSGATICQCLSGMERSSPGSTITPSDRVGDSGDELRGSGHGAGGAGDDDRPGRLRPWQAGFASARRIALRCPRRRRFAEFRKPSSARRRWQSGGIRRQPPPERMILDIEIRQARTSRDPRSRWNRSVPQGCGRSQIASAGLAGATNGESEWMCANDFRQLVAPGEDKTRKLQQARGVRQAAERGPRSLAVKPRQNNRYRHRSRRAGG